MQKTLNSRTPEEIEQYKITLRNKTRSVMVYLSGHMNSQHKLKKSELDFDEIECVTRVSSPSELYKILDYLVEIGFLSYVQGNIIKIANPIITYGYNTDIKPNLNFYSKE